MGKNGFSSEGWRRISLQLEELLQKEIDFLEKAQNGFEGLEKKNYAEKVRVNRNGSSYAYYLIDKKNEVHGKYIKKKDLEKVTTIVQEEYNSRIEADIKRELYFLKILKQNLTYIKNQTALQKMHPGRRKLIKVLCPEDENLIKKWQDTKYEQLNYMEENKKFHTEGGVAVRSKSEKIIGDTLERYGIPYRYEAKLAINRKSMFPDFTILNVKTMEEIYWEHFGKMADIDYREKTYKKIEAYTNAGFTNGRFIATFEETERSINQTSVEKIVEQMINSSP